MEVVVVVVVEVVVPGFKIGSRRGRTDGVGVLEGAVIVYRFL